MRVSRLLVYSPSNGDGRFFAKTCSPPPKENNKTTLRLRTLALAQRHISKKHLPQGLDFKLSSEHVAFRLQTSFERMKCLKKRQHAENNKKYCNLYLCTQQQKKTSRKKKKTTFGMSPKLRPSDVVVLEDLHQRRHLSFVSVDPCWNHKSELFTQKLQASWFGRWSSPNYAVSCFFQG